MIWKTGTKIIHRLKFGFHVRFALCTYIQDGIQLILSISSTKVKNVLQPKRVTISRNFPYKWLLVGWPHFSCRYWKSRGIVIKTYCKISISSWYPLDCLGRGANNQKGYLRGFFFMKGGGSRVPHTYSEKWFFGKPFRIIPWLWKRFALSLGFILCIVVEVTLNMAK